MSHYSWDDRLLRDPWDEDALDAMDDPPELEVATRRAKRLRVKRDDNGGAFGVVKDDEYVGSTGGKPYEQLDPRTLRKAQVEVARHFTGDEPPDDDLRFWLTGLGLIEDNYPPPPNEPARRKKNHRRKKESGNG